MHHPDRQVAGEALRGVQCREEADHPTHSMPAEPDALEPEDVEQRHQLAGEGFLVVSGGAGRSTIRSRACRGR